MLVKHSFLYLLGRLIPGAASLVALALYTRLLAPDEYGHYALVIATVSVVNAVGFQWLSLSLGRFLPAQELHPEALLSTALAGFLVLVLITGGIGGAAAWFWPDQALRWFIVLAVVIGWAQAWFDLNLRIVNARLTPVLYGVLTSVKAVLAISFGVALFYRGLGVVGILLGSLIGLLLTTLFAWRHWRGISFRLCQLQMLKNFIGYGAPLTLTFILALILDVSDRYLLGWLLNAKAVGAYAAAYDLTQQSLGMLMSVIHLAAFPLVVRVLEEKGIAEAQERLRQNALLLLAISIPATVGLVMLANNIAGVMLGAEFQDNASRIITVVALGVFANGFRAFYLDYSFQLALKMKRQLLNMLVAALTNVALNLWWIPEYGVIGAAYATLGAFLVGIPVSWFLGRAVFPMPLPPKESYKVVLASAGMGAALWLTIDWRGPTLLVSQVAIGCLAYGLLMFIFNLGNARRMVIGFKR